MSFCNICPTEYDEYSIPERSVPFCDSCYTKWLSTYRLCNQYSGVGNINSKDPRFDSEADTYTAQAQEQVQKCLSAVLTRDPVHEESIDVMRRRQYHKLRKFDSTKVDPSL